MKIAMVQLQSAKGDYETNINKHHKFIEQAATQSVQVIIFPELSLTNYEPELAQSLAKDPADPIFDIFQTLSNQYQMVIGIGAPTRHGDGVCISMLLFQPGLARVCYSKRYLHQDEEPFFVSGSNFPTLAVNGVNLGLAICYELSIPEHAAAASTAGADIYIASVAKHERGVDGANERLAAIAREYQIPVLLGNNLGPADNFMGAGRSAAWDNRGNHIGSLDRVREGLLIFDTSKQHFVTRL